MSAATELAWAAGFFDGEGGTYCVNIKAAKDGSREPYKQLILCLAQKHREPLDRFLAAIGEGRVTGPYPHDHCYQIRVSRQSEVRRVVALLWPYLCSIKRAQAQEAIAAYDAYKAEKAAQHRQAQPGRALDGTFAAGHAGPASFGRTYLKSVG